MLWFTVLHIKNKTILKLGSMFLSCQIGRDLKKMVVKNQAYQVTARSAYEVLKFI